MQQREGKRKRKGIQQRDGKRQRKGMQKRDGKRQIDGKGIRVFIDTDRYIPHSLRSLKSSERL